MTAASGSTSGDGSGIGPEPDAPGDSPWPAGPGPVKLADLTPRTMAALSLVDLTALAAEVRAVLIQTVSHTGGHLGPNLGVVELTMSVHRRFHAEEDVILWDTGHQSYVHKLITGRAQVFRTLRASGGLSGYPCRAESSRDWIENSHASMALSYAHGLALRAVTSGGRVVVIVGDGALTGGVAYEGLANIGFARLPVVVIYNDNGVSYAPTRGFLSASNPDGGGAARGFFEALGFRVIGPVDGHDFDELDAALSLVPTDEPTVVHVQTIKGRGYGPAERDTLKRMHDTAPFDVPSGQPTGEAKVLLTDLFGTELVRIAERHVEVHAITAAMPGPVGLLPFAARFPDRFHDVGISEQHAVGFAVGLAMAGCRPVVALYAPFVLRAADQILYDVALHGLPVTICLDRAGTNSADGASYHALYDMPFLLGVPGLQVLCPSSGRELEAMLRYALVEAPGPVVIRYPKAEPRREELVATSSLQARRLIGGDGRLALVGVGRTVAMAEATADHLASRDVHAEVWSAVCAAPLDPRMLEALGKADHLAVIEDGVVEGGIGSAIAGGLAHLDDPPRVHRFGLPRAFLPQGSTSELLAANGLTPEQIAHRLMLAIGSPAAEVRA